MIEVVSQVKGLDVFNILKNTGSIMEGHFELSSGYHSNYYLQCAKLLRYPDITYKLAGEAINLVGKDIDIKRINTIVSPAIGGILWGYMLAYRAGCEMVFTERINKDMELRRGFKIEKDKEVIIAEDVITTGGSVKEVIEICKSYGAKIKAIISIVDRSNNLKFEYPYYYLIKLNIKNYLPSECGLCMEKHPLTYPGSRKKL
ncbi:MAG: orotate phosphoribosyltransferase [Actinomycetota bacterium]|nr:orotate phosphoribosyltransferase [Actinomycetota bacterium]